jgi:hypothetical protein
MTASLQNDLEALRLTRPPISKKQLAAAVVKHWPPAPGSTLKGWGWDQVAAYQRLFAGVQP